MDYPISVPSIGLVGGKFADENPVAGTPGSLIPAQWGNAVTDEILNVITSAGLAPNETLNTQLASAIALIINAGRPMSSPVVGSSRNLRCSIAGATASATITADEVVVKSALGGMSYVLPSFSKTINIASVGAGGMDTGTAPVSGYVALYAIYNPSTQAAALLARNASAAVQPSVYGGANMPSGYTASALLSVWPTNASAQLVAGLQIEKSVSIPFVTVLSTNTPQASVTALSISSAAPLNARRVSGSLGVASTSTTPNTSLTLFGSGAGVGSQGLNTSVGASGGNSAPFRDLPIAVGQTIYYSATSSAGTPTFTLAISGYEI